MLHFSWLTVLAGVLFAAPNLFPASTLVSLPDWLPKQKLTLGLDLQGGSHILLQFDRQDLAEERLARTVLTGVTTLLALVALSIWGGEVIRSFTIAMIFGILVGIYSSVFIAGPLLILFKLRPGTFSPRRSAAAMGPRTRPAEV